MHNFQYMSKDKLLKAIEEKYKKLGVPLDSMLEGLLWSTPITYWDYIQTDALLGLQIPRTDQPDEMVFIMYHQVNELLFKMVLWEIDQVAKTDEVSAEKFAMHLMRISRYLIPAKDRGITFKSDIKRVFGLDVDADLSRNWEREDHDRSENCLSRTGYIFKFNNCPIIWNLSYKQKYV